MGLFGHFGALCAFGAMVCLILASISVPVTNVFFYLEANTGNGGTLKLGNWGACAYQNGVKMCTARKLGYHIDGLVDQLTNGNNNGLGNALGSDVKNGLTYALVLAPITAGLAALAVLFGAGSNLIGHVLGSIVAFFAWIVSVVLLGIVLGLFIDARHNLRDAGFSASLGNSVWLVLAACALLLIASITICCGSLQSRRDRRRSGYAADQQAMTEKPRRGLFGRRQQVVV